MAFRLNFSDSFGMMSLFELVLPNLLGDGMHFDDLDLIEIHFELTLSPMCALA